MPVAAGVLPHDIPATLPGARYLNPRTHIGRRSARLALLATLLAIGAGNGLAGPLPQSAGDPTRLPPLVLPLSELWHSTRGTLPLSTWRAPLTKDLLVLPSAHAVEAVDPRTGARRWHTELSFSPRSAAFHADVLLVGGVADEPGNVDLVALDANTGAIHYQLATGGVFVAPIASPLAATSPADDRLVVASTHRLLAFTRDAGRIAWQVEFARRPNGLPGGPGLASPAFIGDVVLTGAGDGYLHAFSAATGALAWKIDLGRPLSAGIASDGRLAIFTSGSTLIALDASGREHWRLGLGGDASFATPVVDRGVVYVATGTGGAVTAITAATGRRLWQKALGAPVMSRPAIARDHLVVGDMANRLSVLNLADGTCDGQWSLGTEGGVFLADPAIAGDVVGVGTTAGVYHVFTAAAAPTPAAPAASLLVSAPNPFRSATTLTIPGPAIDRTELRIYDVRGRMVRVLAADHSQISWDGRNEGGALVPAGLYFARLAGAPTGTPAIKLERLP